MWMTHLHLFPLEKSPKSRHAPSRAVHRAPAVPAFPRSCWVLALTGISGCPFGGTLGRPLSEEGM